jgi:hypothetical protein
MWLYVVVKQQQQQQKQKQRCQGSKMGEPAVLRVRRQQRDLVGGMGVGCSFCSMVLSNSSCSCHNACS